MLGPFLFFNVTKQNAMKYRSASPRWPCVPLADRIAGMDECLMQSPHIKNANLGNKGVIINPLIYSEYELQA